MSNTKNLGQLLLLVPAYNEASRLPKFLRDFAEAQALVGSKIAVRCFVLDDGSLPSESEAMKVAVSKCESSLSGSNFSVTFLRFDKNRGKGGVLRAGFEMALADPQWDVVGFLDADSATQPLEGCRLADILFETPNLDGVLGARLKCLGYQVERSLKRHISGRIFATLVSNFFNIPVYDSQCGAKFIRRRALSSNVLQACTNNGWLFDLQLILVLWSRGHSLKEVPVNWVDQDGSKISLVRDALKMFWQLWKMKKTMTLSK